MAESSLIVKFTWENTVQVKVQAKQDDAAYITILEMDENGELAKLWPSAKAVLSKYLDAKLDGIGEVMTH